MQTKLTERFWEDEGIAALATEEKLAVVWLLTNSGVNVLGITEVTNRKFEFDTGLKPEALWRACQALPESFVRDGQSVLAVNFIRYQIGTGESLMNNNLFVTLKRTFQGVLSEAHRAALLAKVPELGIALQSPSKPFKQGKPSPSPSKGKEKEEENKQENSSFGKGCGEGDCPDDGEVLAFAAGFAGEPATGTPGPIPPEFAAAWLARMLGRREFPPRWQRALIAEWRSAQRTGARPGNLAASGQEGKTAPKKNGALVSRISLEQEARKLRERVETHKALGAEAGYDLSGYTDEVLAELRADLKAKKMRLAELDRQLAEESA